MNALIRAALVGAVIGLAEHALVTPALEHGERLAFLALLAGPFPAGMLLSFWAKLPRWWLLSVMGPIAVGMCMAMIWLWPGVTTNLGEWGGRLVFMGLGAFGFTLAAALVMPMPRATRLITVAVLAVGGIAVRLGTGAGIVLVSTQVAAHQGVPVVAPELPEHRLTHVRATGQELALTYERDGATIGVVLRTRGELTPQRACQEEYSVRAECQEVTPGVWTNERSLDMELYSVRGAALVVLKSSSATRVELLDALGTLRPVGWWELAWQ
ncbi:hypothetical protein [Nonomuraea rubra]|uniref:hypothetical protein n=1 Tax=Nonomuraea rubra TaxID=46180 RepID=UPI0033D3EE04